MQISSLDDYETKEPAYLAKIKDQAARFNMVIDGGMGCICPTSHSFSKNGPPARERVLEGLRVAHAVGAKAMRCFMGSSADRSGDLPLEAHIENTVAVLKSVRQEALDMGVKIAIENHDGDMQARETKMLIEEAGKDFVGSNLDTGNPLWVVEDPFVALETLAPLRWSPRTSAIRWCSRSRAARPDSGWCWAVASSTSISCAFPRCALADMCPAASMRSIEIITGRPPRVIPTTSKRISGRRFPKRWLQRVRTLRCRAGKERASLHGRHGGGRHSGRGNEAARHHDRGLKEQQRIDLERSLEYAKKKMNVGVNWRS